MSIKNIAINLALLLLFVAGIALGFYLAQPNTIFFMDRKTDSDNSLIIRQNLQIPFQVTPAAFSALPHIGGSPKLLEAESLSKEEQTGIMQAMNAIAEKVKTSKICDGGSYALKPRTYWVKDMQKNGYEASQDLRCTFKEEEKSAYETLLHDIMQIVNANAFLALSIPPVTPIIKSEDHANALHKVRVDMLETMRTKVLSDYEQSLGAKCQIVEFNFNDTHARPYLAKSNGVMYAASSDAVVLPTIGAEEHFVRADFSLSCKQEK